jgi:hypothetical protein
MKSFRCLKPFTLLLAFSLSAPFASAAAGWTSALWGKAGEAWSADSRLPDFSLAGYGAGQAAIPDYPVRLNVKDLGAKGDGATDDTAAFLQALRTVPEGGAVLVPAGRYVISDVLEITRSGVVLRGEGPDKSILVMPKPLSVIHPRVHPDKGKMFYSFTGGFVVLKGSDEGTRLGNVAASAKRGDTSLTLASPTALKPGVWIRLVLKNPEDNSLLRHLHGDLLEPGKDTVKMPLSVDWAAQVVAVDGARLTLNRPLRVDVRPEWRPQIFALAPTLRGSGVEKLGLEFPGVPKRPHLQEEGYNAIHITGAVNCWVRDVTVTDADNGVIMDSSRFCTVDGFVARAAKRVGITGHHALWATGRTQDALFIRFRCDTTYDHDLTVEGFASGNVFTHGSGVAVNFDHHRNAPYENLFTDIDAGSVRRLFQSSGRGDRGPHSGARTTFWNIRGAGKLPAMPPPNHWPLINLIGAGAYPAAGAADGPWVESGEGEPSPANLWEAQVARRGANAPAPRGAPGNSTCLPSR